MKTLDHIKEYNSKTLDGRDLIRLVKYLPEDCLEKLGIELKDEFKGNHMPVEFTREAVLEDLKGDVEFAFEKALNQRGLSASMMYEVVSMWNWILEEGLEDFDDYAQYGLPLFKATALKYGFDNPIGDDSGSENKYAA